MPNTHEASNNTVAPKLDPDRLLMRSMAALIEFAKWRYPLRPGDEWRPGKPLKLLLAGYNGTRNTGADARVEEIVRQLEHLLGDVPLELSVLTIDKKRSEGYFGSAKQVKLPLVFPEFLLRTVHGVHGVIACEGSMFKSKFASALSTMMVGAVGLALAEQKIAVGYGGEAGAMDQALADLVRKYTRGALILSRTRASQQVLAKLGVRSELGTDTAWTFNPAPKATGEALLKQAGWDGSSKVLIVCPINAFWWPVRPDLKKLFERKVLGRHKESHYASLYFHADGPEVKRKQAAYIEGLAAGVEQFRQEAAAEGESVFPVLVAMEALDRRACEALRKRLGFEVPILGSDEHDMFSLVSVLRAASYLLSSRYHAVVTSMPGSVPSAGVTMDERIHNLMDERGQPELSCRVDDEDLGRRVAAMLSELRSNRERVVSGIERCVLQNLERMAQMGVMLIDQLKARHSELPLRPGLGSQAQETRKGNGAPDLFAHLPPLSSDLQKLVERARQERTRESGPAPVRSSFQSEHR